MKITWINHASYLLESGEVRLVCDPWLEGPAHNNGWRLLAPTQFPYESFAAVTHIWFSHEHPDHFSPPVLKRIPAQYRAGITVIFRETRDRRVVTFCRNAGFKALELRPNASYELGATMRILCGTAGSDSWLRADSGTFQLLNINDCVLGTARDLERIARQVPRVDVLLTQFSYANWCGNRGDAQAHRAAADGKLADIALQVRVLKPRWVVPFASFIWFSHEENRHMNEYVNHAGDAARVIEKLGVKPVVLYPGDIWNIGDTHDASRAIELYERDGADVSRRAFAAAIPTPFPTIQEAAKEFCSRLRRRNMLWTLKPLQWLRLLVPIRIYLGDCDRTVSFDMFSGVTDLGQGAHSPDIEMSGESLLFALKFDYGFDTLLINGRFQERVPGAHRMLSRQFGVARYNNNALTFPAMFFSPGFLLSHLREG
jgi:hypothetical protein